MCVLIGSTPCCSPQEEDDENDPDTAEQIVDMLADCLAEQEQLLEDRQNTIDRLNDRIQETDEIIRTLKHQLASLQEPTTTVSSPCLLAPFLPPAPLGRYNSARLGLSPWQAPPAMKREEAGNTANGLQPQRHPHPTIGNIKIEAHGDHHSGGGDTHPGVKIDFTFHNS